MKTCAQQSTTRNRGTTSGVRSTRSVQFRLRGNCAVPDSVACVRLPRHAQVALEETKIGSDQWSFRPIVGCQHHEVESCQGKRGLQFLRKHQVLFILTKSFDHRNLFELVRQVPFGIWSLHLLHLASCHGGTAFCESPCSRWMVAS